MARTPTQLMIDPRFCGPPDSANGGYACGIVARSMDAPAAEVTLRLPPPLEMPLTVEASADGARLTANGDLVAEGRTLPSVELTPPDPVSLADAREASRGSPLHGSHPFPTCFVCGPRREPGDGLRIIPGPVAGREVVASPWTPDGSLPLDGDEVATEICWAALDCPSGNALMLLDGVGTAVLGRLAARLERPVEVGSAYVAVGWPLAREERKLDTASALFTEDGELVGVARARWVELRTDALT